MVGYSNTAKTFWICNFFSKCNGFTSTSRYVNVDGSKTLQTKDVKLKNTSHDVQASESQYTELDKDLKEAESAYDAISTM
jgi:hypothetical protein